MVLPSTAETKFVNGQPAALVGCDCALVGRRCSQCRNGVGCHQGCGLTALTGRGGVESVHFLCLRQQLRRGLLCIVDLAARAVVLH